MKIIITKLDNGYTVSVQVPAVPAQGDTPEIPEEKKRFAFESDDSMYEYLNQLIPIPVGVIERAVLP